VDLKKFEFPAHSAVFHITKGLIFNRTIAFRVRAIYPDKNDKNIRIENKERLKTILFEKIRDMYNQRLNATGEPSNYRFTEEFKKKMAIGNDKIDVFKLQLFQLSSGSTEEFDHSQIGGVYAVYPLTFVCKKCGDLQIFNEKNIDVFNPNKCVRTGCDGAYEQLSLMLFCETCGKVQPFRYSFNNEKITLIRSSKDSIATWRVRAESKEAIDVFRLMCKHRDPFDFRSGKVISDADPSQQRPLTVTEGSIFIPVAHTSIDIPTSPDIELEDLEYVLNGISMGMFDFLSEIVDVVDIKTIQELYSVYNNLTAKKNMFRTHPSFKGKNEEEKEKSWKALNFIDQIEQVIERIKKDYPKSMVDTLREINDYAALVGYLDLEKLKVNSYLNYIDSISDQIVREEKHKDFQEIKEHYKIDSIIHIPSVTLVNSNYGIINGINKFYEPGFIPHFEPIWANRSDPNKGFYAYCYPYETEGIVITLSKEAIVQWLYDCKFIKDKPNDPKEFFNSLAVNSEEYKAVNTLLHTFSHLLMRNSSVFTGLDLQSYGEKIFPTSAAIFLFSTSSINIGGLQFVFENEVFNWFENMRFDVSECTLDPSCIRNKGACFSCMYIPEFVCSLFNQYLDRDVFLGKSTRFERGFWW
jgi:hypothetical protein